MENKVFCERTKVAVRKGGRGGGADHQRPAAATRCRPPAPSPASRPPPPAWPRGPSSRPPMPQGRPAPAACPSPPPSPCPCPCQPCCATLSRMRGLGGWVPLSSVSARDTSSRPPVLIKPCSSGTAVAELRMALLRASTGARLRVVTWQARGGRQGRGARGLAVAVAAFRCSDETCWGEQGLEKQSMNTEEPPGSNPPTHPPTNLTCW